MAGGEAGLSIKFHFVEVYEFLRSFQRHLSLKFPRLTFENFSA